jgi:hypothetical protein
MPVSRPNFGPKPTPDRRRAHDRDRQRFRTPSRCAGTTPRRGDAGPRELKADGVIKSAYRRAAGPGFYFLLEGPSIDAVRERIDTTLPFVIENLATLEYDEIYEI